MTRLVGLGLALALLTSCSPCEDVGPTLGDACLLPVMASDIEIEIEVREDCGTSCSEPPECTALVDLNTVTVITSQLECQVDCVPDGVCQRRTARCLLPPLTQGEYQVIFPGLPARTLRVEPGAPFSCSL